MKKIKKYFLPILLSLTMILVIGAISKTNNSFAYEKYEEYNGFLYSTSDGIATIRGYVGDEKNVIIPEEINKFPVKLIKAEAFKDCTFENITIPKTVDNIESKAFILCYNLKNITVDKDNHYYSDHNGILYNKDKTTLIKCPSAKKNPFILNGVTKIETLAFESTHAERIVVPNSVKFFGGGVFRGSYSLSSVTLPDSLTYIDTECGIEETYDDFGYIFTFTPNIKEIWLYKDSYAYNFLNDKYNSKIKLIDKKSTLNITNENYPKTLISGKSFDLKGEINSNYKLEYVTVQVLDEKGNPVPTASKEISKLDSYTYSDINSDIKLETLPEGIYTYKIEALDQSGTAKTLVNNTFRVVNSEETYEVIATGKIKYGSNVRSEASKSSTKLGYLPKGTAIEILDVTDNGWCKIKYNGSYGYVYSDYIEIDTTILEGEIKYGSNVRSKASKSSTKLGYLPKGTAIEILDVTDNGWCKIKYNGSYGYIYSDYIEVIIEGTINHGSNVRSKASKSSTKLGYLSKGTVVKMIDITDNGWCKIKYNGSYGYVYAKYVEVN